MDEKLISETEAYLDEVRTWTVEGQQSVRKELEQAFLVMLSADEDRFAAAFSRILITPRMIYFLAHKERYIGAKNG